MYPNQQGKKFTNMQ